MSIPLIISRPLNILNSQGKPVLGSELGVLRILREAKINELEVLLENGLHSDSIACLY